MPSFVLLNQNTTLQVYFRKNELQSKNIQTVPNINHSNMRGVN